MPVQGEGAIRLTTARYYTPSGRSIQALGVAPDIIVEQRLPGGGGRRGGRPTRRTRTEADLRGSLENDSLTEDEKKILEEDRKHKEETARLRAEDYQLSYAIDILRGMSYLAAARTGRTDGWPAHDRGGDPGAALPAVRRDHADRTRRGASSPGSGSTTRSRLADAAGRHRPRARRRATRRCASWSRRPASRPRRSRSSPRRRTGSPTTCRTSWCRRSGRGATAARGSAGS